MNNLVSQHEFRLCSQRLAGARGQAGATRTRATHWLGRCSAGFLAVFLAGSLCHSEAAALLEDGFGYLVGNLPSPWSNPGSAIQVASGSLLYSGLADVSGGNNKVAITAGTSRTQFRSFTSVSNNTLYCGFLMQCTLLPTNSQFILSVTTNGATGLTAASEPMTLYVTPPSSGTGYQFRIRHRGTTEMSATNVFNTNEIHFVVMKYTFGGSGQADLYLDPSPVGTEPATANATASGGVDTLDLTQVGIKAQSTNAQGNWNLDTLRIGTNWADVAPAGSTCVPPSVATNPSDQTATAGTTAAFSIAANGSSPTYQWQRSTNGGGSWANVTGGSGATSLTYTTPILVVSDNGAKYRCAVSVSCGGGATTNSAAATLTVNPVSTATGLLVDDVFALPRTTAINLTTTPTNHTEWYAAGSATAPGLTNLAPFSMTGTAQTNSRLWLTYFTSNNFAPIHLNVGETIKATLKFSIDSSSDNTSASLRLGLYNFSLSGAARLSGDQSSGNANGNNVPGYMALVNFSSVFHASSPNPPPIGIQVRTNLADANLMGASSDYINLGSGGGQEGEAGFIAGNTYTNVFSVTRSNASTVGITVSFTGPGLNVSFTQTDTLGTNNVDFDSFALRPANDATTATNFTFTEFKVEKTGSSSAFIITSIRSLPPGQQVLTWQSQSGGNYVVESRAAVNSGNWTTNATVAAAGSSTSYTNTAPGPIYFRVGQTP